MTNILPQAKNSGLVVQELGQELLIYNLKTNKAFTLNETLMIVFNACDGKTSFAELQHQSKFTEDLIYLSLDILRDKELLAGDYQSKFVGVSRREVIKKVGLACTVALPVIAGIVVPPAAAAASNPGKINKSTCLTQSVGASTECQSGYCVQTFPSNTLHCCTQLSSNTIGTPREQGYPISAINDQPTCDIFAAASCCSGSGTIKNRFCVCN